MTINSLEVLIREWADKRGLCDNTGKFQGQSFKQLAKLNSEIGELAESLIKRDYDELRDAIGDCMVVLCILAYQNDTSLAECLQMAYTEIKDRTGETKDGVFIKD